MKSGFARTAQRTLAIAFSLFAAACVSPLKADHRSDLHKIAANHVAEGFSGVVLVATGDNAILHEAFGGLAGKSVVVDDRFWIASTGKQFVSAAMLKLADEGKLTLDDPLSRFFPEAPAEKAAITVRQLLSHSSGYAQSYVAEAFPTREAATPAMLSEPLEGAPGDKFRYSNLNFQLAAAIVEIASGENYREYVAQRLWAPAGLTSTGFSTPETARGVSAILPPPPRASEARHLGRSGRLFDSG